MITTNRLNIVLPPIREEDESIIRKKLNMTPAERKAKVNKLMEEHKEFFNQFPKRALYIPKMAYRPPGKDDLYVSFFPSEMKKGQGTIIYTEFVSIDYDAEDPKRTLYAFKVPKNWVDKYELVTSNSGFERHLIPVSELTAVSDVTSKIKNLEDKIKDVPDYSIPNPETERDIVDVLKGIEKALLSINSKLK